MLLLKSKKNKTTSTRQKKVVTSKVGRKSNVGHKSFHILVALLATTSATMWQSHDTQKNDILSIARALALAVKKCFFCRDP